MARVDATTYFLASPAMGKIILTIEKSNGRRDDVFSAFRCLSCYLMNVSFILLL